MFPIIAILAIVLSLMLIGMVLLQPSKSGAVGGMLGQVNSNLGATFGSRRTLDFLAKGTTYVALGLGILCVLANLVLDDDTGEQGKGFATQGKVAVPTTTAPPAGGAQQPGQAGQPGQQQGGQQPAQGGQQGGTQPAQGGGTTQPSQPAQGGGTTPPPASSTPAPTDGK